MDASGIRLWSERLLKISILSLPHMTDSDAREKFLEKLTPKDPWNRDTISGEDDEFFRPELEFEDGFEYSVEV